MVTPCGSRHVILDGKTRDLTSPVACSRLIRLHVCNLASDRLRQRLECPHNEGELITGSLRRKPRCRTAVCINDIVHMPRSLVRQRSIGCQRA